MPRGTDRPAEHDPRRFRPPRGRPRDDVTSPGEPSGREDLVVVQFKGHRKSYYHNRRAIELKVGSYCLVEADRGQDLGRATYIGPGKAGWWKIADRQGVLACATPADLARLHQNRGDEWEFWDICQEKIQARRLKMDLVTVERQFDHKKITFYFTAEKRVDFRQLVRDLAAIFRTRIELRQIGVRDEARLKGGIGICGREICCAAFLHDFVPVTLKMAKEQQLPLNPGKLSGLCGRLRCCLTYEHASYKQALARLPRVGATVRRDGVSGIVRKLDLVRELVVFERAEDGELETSPSGELNWEEREDLPAPRSQRGRTECANEGRNARGQRRGGRKSRHGRSGRERPRAGSGTSGDDGAAGRGSSA
jgi:cell fate regulator YaaT (PSP1 superfamily)